MSKPTTHKREDEMSARKTKVQWPTGREVTLKCEDDRPCFDQASFIITLKEEMPDAWIGWPHSWKARLYDGTRYQLTSIGLPLSFPKYAWKEPTK